VQIYRRQFPDLYRAVDSGKLMTTGARPIQLGGDTLITYKSAIRKIYGNYFGQLDPAIQRAILRALATVSSTSEKEIKCWDEHGQSIVNNHQIGNMMPFPSGTPSLNALRANAPLYDYFDQFLKEVQGYYARRSDYRPTSGLQKAIHQYRSYFDFFQTYDRFVADNLLQDFVGKDLASITDLHEYLQVVNEIIDSRGKRFTVSA
jgi:hypothetical protein